MPATAPRPRPDRDGAPEPAFVSGLSELAPVYDLILCDVWGVLHDGVTALPGAGPALARFREGGGRVTLVSNAPRPGEEVTGQLDRLGVPRAAYDGIVTSGDLSRAEVEARGAAPVHHIGPARDLKLFAGLPARFAPLDEAEYVVCTGLVDDERETVADYEGRLDAMRARGLLMVCANPDLVVERGHALIPCAGALAAAYVERGGAVVMHGKPHAPIYEAALRQGARQLGRPPRRTLAIGDAIRTDVAGARGAGLDAWLLTRGIHAAEVPDYTALDRRAALAWLAAQAAQPTYVARELQWE